MLIQLSLFPDANERQKKEKEEQLRLNEERFRSNLAKARKSYTLQEEEFQQVQEEWNSTCSVESWKKMFYYVNLAVYNTINKKLIKKLPNEEIEQKALDVTMNIMNNIQNKRERGEFWQILKLSAFVHMPCLAIYAKQAHFEDDVLDESAYTYTDADGKERIKETENSYYKNGVYYI